jgi:hypothetical protein
MPFNPIASAPNFSPANPFPDLSFPGYISQDAMDANPPFTAYRAIMGYDQINSEIYSLVFTSDGSFVNSNLVLSAGAGASVPFSFNGVNTNRGWQIAQRYITAGDANMASVQVNVSGNPTGAPIVELAFLSGVSTYTGGRFTAQLSPDGGFMPGAVNFSLGTIDNSGPVHFWLTNPAELVIDGVMFDSGSHFTLSSGRLGPDPAAPFNYISPIANRFPPNLGLVLVDVLFSNGPFGAGPSDGAYAASFNSLGDVSNFIKFSDEAVSNGVPIILEDTADNRRIILLYDSVLVSTGLVMQAFRNTGSASSNNPVDPYVSPPYAVSIGSAPSMTLRAATMSPDGFIYVLGTSQWVIVYDRNFNFVDEVDLSPYLTEYTYAAISITNGQANGKGFALYVINGSGEWGLWNFVYNPNNPTLNRFDPSALQAVDLGPCMPCFPVLIREGGWAPPIGYKMP